MADLCGFQSGGSFQLENDLPRSRKSYSNHIGCNCLKNAALASSSIAFAGNFNPT
jgi:hypothetical protein